MTKSSWPSGALSRSRKPTPLDWFLRAQLALHRKQHDLALADLALVPDDHVMASQARTAGWSNRAEA